DWNAPDMREAANQRRPIACLELMELATVYDPRDHLMHIVGSAHVLRDDAIEFVRVILGWSGLSKPVRIERSRDARSPRATSRCLDFARQERTREMRHNVAHDGQRMLVILGQMVDNARFSGVEVPAAEVFGADFFPGCGLYQRRAGEENRALIADDHRL